MSFCKFFLIGMISLVIVPGRVFSLEEAKPKLIFQVIQEQLLFESTHIKSATLIDGKNGTFSGLHIELKTPAAEEITRMTTEGLGKQANIIFDKKVITHLTIKSTLSGNLFITGFTKEEAKKFVDYLIKEQHIKEQQLKAQQEQEAKLARKEEKEEANFYKTGTPQDDLSGVAKQ